jgi:hypothetical protein
METDMSDTPDYDAAFEKYEQQIETLQVALAAERAKADETLKRMNAYCDERAAELVSLRSKLDAAEAWQRFANYCRSCAISGESNPDSFEDFCARAALSRQEGGKCD